MDNSIVAQTFHNIYCLPLGVSMIYLLCIAFVWIISVVFVKYKGYHKVWRGLCAAAFIIWVICTLYSTVLGRSSGIREISLLPFYQFYIFLEGSNPEILRSAWMNVLLFVPMGMLLPEVMAKEMNARRKIKISIMAAIAFSIGIEVVQGIFLLGLAETDDVICNVLGACVGCVCYRVNEYSNAKHL